MPEKMPEFENSQEKISQKEKFDMVDEIPLDTLDVPRIIEGKNGKLAFGTDIGVNYPKPTNEDALVINTKKNSFAVIDGMGGMGLGNEAAKILAQEIQKGFQENIMMEQAQKNASQKMSERGLGQAGACYLSCEVFGDELQISQAGDVKLVLYGKDKIKFETTNEGLGVIVTNAVQGTKTGQTTKSSFRYEKGDRLVIGSDGLWDNISPEDTRKAIQGKSAEEAIKILNAAAKAKMTRDGKPDNISVILYELDHISREPEEIAEGDTTFIP